MAIITLNNNALSSVTELPSGISGQNYPAFFAYKDANSTLSDATWTKVICNVETLDTDSAYDTATGEYTFTTSGKYCVFFNAFAKADGNSRCERVIGRIVRERDGTDFSVAHGETDFRSNPGRGAAVSATSSYEFNVGDIIYLEINLDVNAGTGSVFGDSTAIYTSFGSFRIGD